MTMVNRSTNNVRLATTILFEPCTINQAIKTIDHGFKCFYRQNVSDYSLSKKQGSVWLLLSLFVVENVKF